MLFDFFFTLGGSGAVDSAASFFLPFYLWVCDMAANFGGIWDTLATIGEMLFT